MRLSFSVFCVAMAALCAVDADQLRGTLTSVNTAVDRVLAVDERALGTGEDKKSKKSNKSTSYGADSDDASGGKGKGASKGSDADADSDEDESSSKGGKVCIDNPRYIFLVHASILTMHSHGHCEGVVHF